MTDTDALADALAVVLYQEVKAAGWNLEQLGRELGLSEQTLQRYLTRRERDMPASVLTRAAHAIGVPLSDIVESAERRVARAPAPEPEEVARRVGASVRGVKKRQAGSQEPQQPRSRRKA